MKLVLVYCPFSPPDQGTRLRNSTAFRTWPLLGAEIVKYFPTRTSAKLGDSRSMPFILDMIDHGFSQTDGAVIIINHDIIVDMGTCHEIQKHCLQYGGYWALRIPHKGADTDGGADLFAITKSWWQKHGGDYPDLLFGYRWWDAVMLRKMFATGIPEGIRAYYHTPHIGVYSRRGTPGAEYNERLGNDWSSANQQSCPHPYYR